MTSMRELIISRLLNGSMTVDALATALGFSPAVIERELQQMVAADEVVGFVTTANGPDTYHLSDGERHHCRQLRRQRMLS